MNNESNTNFQYKSYTAHKNSYQVNEHDEKEFLLYRDWYNTGTVDVWRHTRMLSHIDPLLTAYPSADWLTVADGRWGTAARYIEMKGGKALATDIDDRLLQTAVQHGLLREYRNENAEKLSFHDDAFDFAYCKESFHHFPRAYVALYEMLRVSKIAVIITEPRDWLPPPFTRRIMQLIKHSIKKLLNMEIAHPDSGNYEPIGNYVFTVSERELQKIALGLSLPAVAFRNFQDVYLEGVEQEKQSDNGPLLKKLKSKLFVNNVLRFIRIEKTNHITGIIFKTPVSGELRRQLSVMGFTIVDLPRNPYLDNMPI